MKERPIIMSAESVRAVLAGKKHMTRRVIPPPQWERVVQRETSVELAKATAWEFALRQGFVRCPFGGVGDRLWVREVWNTWGPPERQCLDYRATCPDAAELKWRPSIHMPRTASRLTLEVVSVRVERLQEITEEDARAEGVATECRYMGRCNSSRCPEHEQAATEGRAHQGVLADFRNAWDALNGKRPGCSWESNPFVWSISFRRLESP